MKKHIMILALFACFCTLPSWAQTNYQKGDFLVNAGLGLGSMIYSGVSFNANAEYFINDDLSLGGGLGYTAYNDHYYSFYGSSLKINVFYFGPRAAYHFTNAFDLENEQLDLYAGAFVGFAIVTASYGGETVSGFSGGPGSFGYDIFGGARYQFTPNIAAYGELGLGISILQLGATFKL